MRWPVCLFLPALLLPPLAAADTPPPRLAVVVVVDQMRADYLVRFRPYFGEGGFKRLLEAGADFQDCHYQHAVTKTAPGHATILSGVNANVHGIVANEWLDRVDPVTFVQINAVEDRAAPLVGLPPKLSRYANATFAAKAGRSPRNFLGTTVGDRLKARYGAAAKVFGVADKDRSAILPAGPKADGAYWTEEGIFVTSTYYRPALPAWVQDFNAHHNAARHFGDTWDRLLAPSVYDAVQGPDNAPGEQIEFDLPVTFPKKIVGRGDPKGAAFFGAFDKTPWNNELVADMAMRCIAEEQLGQDDIPDLLTVGFAQTDAAGHAYGPDSHEVMDSYVRLDRTLASLFAYLDAKVGAGRWVLALTADHGVAPLPEKVQAAQGAAAAGRLKGPLLDEPLNTELSTAFGALPEDIHWWFLHDNSGYHLNPLALNAKGLAPADVARKLREALLAQPLIAAAFTREQLLAPASLGEFDEGSRRSYFPARSPDVVYIPKPYFIERSTAGTTHGTPYDYDTHVPQLWLGAGVKPGVHAERVGVEDLAPTLAGLLGVDLPAAQGKRLF